MIKNDRSILRTDVWSLAIARCRIMVAPENVEQLLVGNFRGIEGHLDDFGMTGLVAADIFISRILGRAAGVANDRLLHPSGLPENGFHAPETACSESRF